jgi:hypothetical protein
VLLSAGASLSRLLHDLLSSRLINVSLAAVLVFTTLIPLLGSRCLTATRSAPN